MLRQATSRLFVSSRLATAPCCFNAHQDQGRVLLVLRGRGFSSLPTRLNEQERLSVLPAPTLNPPSSSSQLLSLISSMDIFSRLLGKQVPKGFEDFFPGEKPKEDTSPAPPTEKKDDSTKPDTAEKPFFSAKKGDDKGGEDGGDPKMPDIHPGVWIAGGAVIVALWLFSSSSESGSAITYQAFQNSLLDAGLVEKVVVVNGRTVRVYTRLGQEDHAPVNSTGKESYRYYFTIGSIESFERKLEEAQRSLGVDPRDFIPVIYQNESSFLNELGKFLPTLLFIGVWLLMMRGMSSGSGPGRNIFQIGAAKPQIFKGDSVKTTFKDVAGLDEAKVEIMEFVEFLRSPARFHELGAKIPKGALLVGPPGTGKTLLARAVAGEAGVPFFSMSGSDFIEMFVGVGPSRVRDLFKQARAKAPCIVFIDEIDAVGRARGKNGFGGGNDERENTLNQLLVEMDGFTPMTGVVVLAGTNRADVLDPALLRPGRFDRQVSIDKPDIKGRHQIFLVHLKHITLRDDIDGIARRMAALTPGFSGADIANVCNEAALIAARGNKKKVEIADFESATERVIGGLEKKSKVMSLQERTLVAYHEAGHAIAGWFLEHADPVLKISIVPRGIAALGYNQFLPRELSLFTQEQLLDMMCMALGGRVSEEMVFNGRISTGASDDLDRVTKMAYSQVAIYGFNDRIGTLSYQDNGSQQMTKPYSEATAQMIDEEARKMVKSAYERTRKILNERRADLEKVAKLLLAQETITHDEIVELLGPRPFSMSENYKQFVQSNQEWADRRKPHHSDPAAPAVPSTESH